MYDLKPAEDNEEGDEHIIDEFFKLFVNSRLAKNTALAANIIIEIITPRISRRSYVKYDELTIKNLLYAKNLDRATFCGPIKEDLMKKSKEMIQEGNIDPERKRILEAFLDSENMQLIERFAK